MGYITLSEYTEQYNLNLSYIGTLFQSHVLPTFLAVGFLFSMHELSLAREPVEKAREIAENYKNDPKGFIEKHYEMELIDH